MRKPYILIADRLLRLRRNEETHRLIVDLANIFQTQHSSFKRNDFLKYCKIRVEKCIMCDKQGVADYFGNPFCSNKCKNKYKKDIEKTSAIFH